MVTNINFPGCSRAIVGASQMYYRFTSIFMPNNSILCFESLQRSDRVLVVKRFPTSKPPEPLFFLILSMLATIFMVIVFMTREHDDCHLPF